MTEVLFYHLQSKPLEQVLPGLLERSLQRDWRVVVKAGNEEKLGALNSWLWTYREDSFLPHGTRADGPPENVPVYLTTEDENTNGGHVLFLVEGAAPPDISGYIRCVLMFDGNDEAAVAEARGHWTALKAKGYEASYWQQNETGAWVNKA
ncbi:MAG: DNA polymerase III subunit chi [Rhizobiales bacterium]|nr:DNA polymerase III subunit chi [Hyphomicrobiales bacterium]